MKRTAAPIRISVLLVGVLVFATCSSDAGQVSEETFGGELVGSGTAQESLSEEESAALLEAQRQAEESLELPDDEVVEPSTVTPVDPVTSGPGGVGVEPEGFTTAVVEITDADGTTCEVCMWLADTADERGRGLMGVTSLGRAGGMVFVWGQPTGGAFYMFQTITPLSIAWFAPDGSIVSRTDMDPCLDADSSGCERFPAGGEFDLAIEVFQGDLASIGVTNGATARLVPGSEAAECPLA